MRRPHDPLDWDDLRVALAARRAGSFTAAAAALDLRQSTVSRRVLALEAGLGGALFHRGPAGLVPTALGVAVCAEAERAEAAVARARERADALVGGVVGTVRIAAPPGLAHYWLVPRLPELQARFPGLRFELAVSTALADLARDEADLAVRFGPPGDPALVARRLGGLPQAVLGDPRWLGRDAAAWAWVALDHPADLRWIAACAAAPPVLVSADYLTVLAAARCGLGVMLGSRALLELNLGLVELPAPVPVPPPAPLWLVARPEARPLARVDAVWRAVVGWASGVLVG